MSARLLYSGICGSNVGNLLHQIGTLTKGAVYCTLDGVAYRIRDCQLIERLNLERQRSALADRRCQVSSSDRFGSEHRLQIIFSLGSRATRFQDVR